MALYEPQQHRASVFLYGDGAGVVCHSQAAWVLWRFGYPNQGLARSHEALTLAQQGQARDGIEQMHQGLTAYRATGAEILRPYFLALLAEAYG
jgi:predicted ATPase